MTRHFPLYQSQMCKDVYPISPAIKYALVFQSNLFYVLKSWMKLDVAS